MTATPHSLQFDFHSMVRASGSPVPPASAVSVSAPARPWFEQVLGRFPHTEVTRRLAPLDLGPVSVSSQPGVQVTTYEVAPGLWIVAAAPDVGAAQTPAPRGANIGAIIGSAVGDVVTTLGDWVAGWFPKAQAARQAAATAANEAENDAIIDDALTQAKLLRIQARTAAQLADAGYLMPMTPLAAPQASAAPSSESGLGSVFATLGGAVTSIVGAFNKGGGGAPAGVPGAPCCASCAHGGPCEG